MLNAKLTTVSNAIIFPMSVLRIFFKALD